MIIRAKLIYKLLNKFKLNMKHINIIIAILVLLSFKACTAQIENVKTENLKIYGNCGMCKTTIEKAGNNGNISKVIWDKETKIANISYNSKETNLNEILKRIALSGYDNEKFLAPNEVYAKLPECCQYKRETITLANIETPKIDSTKIEMKEYHSNHHNTSLTETKQEAPNLTSVFDKYFEIKDALVNTEGSIASNKAKELLAVINLVNMKKLAAEEHYVWMKVKNDLAVDAEHISDTKDASHQRDHFVTLSENIYKLIKVSKQEMTIYYQFCPMFNDGKGANWLSKEEKIKNPYYGSQMLSCGKTVETIK